MQTYQQNQRFNMFVKKKVSPINCTNFGHMSVLLSLLFFSGLSLAGEKANSITLEQLDPTIKTLRRGPSNFVPDIEITPLPLQDKSWTQQILVEDDAGVLVGVRDNLDKWQKRQEYAKTWNLESTGVYDVVSVETKKAYLQKMILKYADKRLSGEVRKAEKGSTLHSVGQAQKALKPNAEAKISENIKLKFKARVLQGKATMTVKNPYVDYSTTANLKGEINMDAKKEFKTIGLKAYANYRADADELKVKAVKNFETLNVQATIDYEVSNESWTATLEKPIYKRLIGRVSSSQSERKMILGNGSNQRMEVMFNHAF